MLLSENIHWIHLNTTFIFTFFQNIYWFRRSSINIFHFFKGIQISVKTNLKMYFTVFILQTKQHVVVPFTWIKMNRHIPNIINNGINPGIKLWVFYTDDTNAFFHGSPRIGYAPNENAGVLSEFPKAGWYQCRIRKFHGMITAKITCFSLQIIIYYSVMKIIFTNFQWVSKMHKITETNEETWHRNCMRKDVCVSFQQQNHCRVCFRITYYSFSGSVRQPRPRYIRQSRQSRHLRQPYQSRQSRQPYQSRQPRQPLQQFIIQIKVCQIFLICD